MATVAEQNVNEAGNTTTLEVSAVGNHRHRGAGRMSIRSQHPSTEKDASHQAVQVAALAVMAALVVWTGITPLYWHAVMTLPIGSTMVPHVTAASLRVAMRLAIINGTVRIVFISRSCKS